MNLKMRRSVILMAVMAFVVSLAMGEAGPPNPIALFLIVKNKVEKGKTEHEWVGAKKGDMLYGDNFVRTFDKSFALVRFTDNSTLRLGPNAEVQIKGERTLKGAHIEKGEVGFKVHKSESGTFEFTTPTSVASIRGTEGLLTAQTNGTDFLTILRGLVMMINQYSHDSVNVGAGQTGVSSRDGSITVHNSTGSDLNKLNQLNGQLGQLHKLKMWFKGSDGQLHEIEIETEE